MCVRISNPRAGVIDAARRTVLRFPTQSPGLGSIPLTIFERSESGLSTLNSP